MMIDPFVIVGVFILGAGSGGLCVWLHQISIRAEFRKELTERLDSALFDPIRRQRQPL